MDRKDNASCRRIVLMVLLALHLPSCSSFERPVQMTTEGLRATLHGHTDGITGVAFAPNGSILASSSLDSTVRLWSVTSGDELMALRGHPNQVDTVVFSPDGTLLASGNGTYLGSTGRIGQREGGTPYMILDGTPVPLPNMVILWDVATATEKARWHGFETAFWTVAFSPDGRLLAAGGGTPTGMLDDAVRLWDVPTGELRARWEQSATAWSITFSPDGTLLAVGTDNKAALWDVATGETKASLDRGPIRSVAFSPDGTLLACGNAVGDVRLWEIATYQERAEWGKHEGVVYALAFSPDGSTLASAGRDGLVHIWDVRQAKKQTTIAIPETWIGGVAFSPDGALLATGSSDGLIRLWSVAELLGR